MKKAILTSYTIFTIFFIMMNIQLFCPVDIMPMWIMGIVIILSSLTFFVLLVISFVKWLFFVDTDGGGVV